MVDVITKYMYKDNCFIQLINLLEIYMNTFDVRDLILIKWKILIDTFEDNLFWVVVVENYFLEDDLNLTQIQKKYICL